MKYVVIALLALILGSLIGRAMWGEKAPQPADPLQIIVTQLKTHAVIEHERQLAIWYRACPSVWGKTPQIFIAWPAKLSYQLELADTQVKREGAVIKVKTAAIQPREPSVPTDFVDSLATTSIFTFANEQELVNREVGKASPIARYLTTYFLAHDQSLPGEFEHELRTLVTHLATALGMKVARVEVEIPKPQVTWPHLPQVELCEGTRAAVNGLPFAKYEDGYTIPIGFNPAPAGMAKGIASVFGGSASPKR